MSDVSQPVPGSRLSRRSLREREQAMAASAQQRPAQIEVEVPVGTGPVATSQAEPVATGPFNAAASGFDTPTPRNLAITELDTAPTAAAPVSRVVRRSTTQMAPRRTQPPTPAVFQPAPVVSSPVEPTPDFNTILDPASDFAGAPPESVPFAPVDSVAAPDVVPVAPFAPVASINLPPADAANAGVVGAGAPPWEAITSGAHPESIGSETVRASQRAERHALRSAEAARVPPPSAGYTWVQYLILLAVAFVLGLLLWQLIVGEIPNPLDGVLHLGTPFSQISIITETRI